MSRYNKKQKKNIKKKKEKNPPKNRENQTTTINIFVYSFLYGEKYISLENNLEKPFFKFRDICNAVVKYQRCYRFALGL